MDRLWVRITLLFTVVLTTAIAIPILLIAVFGSFETDAERAQRIERIEERHAELEAAERAIETDEITAPNGGHIRKGRGIWPRQVWERIPSVIFRLALGMATLGAIAGSIASRLISRPFSKMALAANMIGQGDFTHRVEVSGPREIEALSTAFNSMAADLQESEALRSNLLADVSHELRTPLTVLEGNLRGVIDGVFTLDDAELANLYGQTNLLIRLVEDLHLLSRAEAKQLPLNLGQIDLGQLVQEAAFNFELLAKEQAIALETSVSEGLPLVLADRQRVHQILANLFSNAVRHTPAGGTITATVQQDGPMVTINVTDTGAGIAAEHLPYLFDRFYRTDKSRSRETGGSGLGLAIASVMCEALGGSLTAASPGIGLGTTFTISLPIVSESV